MGEEQVGRRRKMIIIGVAVVVALALLAWGASKLMGGKSGKAPKAPKIQVMAPPPPPPPPPKFEKKPDPPKEQKEMKVEQAVPKEAPQASPELKMEGPAGNGPSAFAAGKVSSEDLSKLGTGKADGSKGGMFSPFNNYANLLKGELQRYLSKNNALRKRRYTVEVHVWVGAGGALKRFELIGSSGDSDTDEAIKQAIAELKGFSQSSPADMPQPIRLRIVTSG